MLRVEGLVTPHQGKGVFVRRRPDRGEPDATSEIIAEGDGRGGVARLLEASYTIPSEPVAILLQLTDPAEEGGRAASSSPPLMTSPSTWRPATSPGHWPRAPPSANIWS